MEALVVDWGSPRPPCGVEAVVRRAWSSFLVKFCSPSRVGGHVAEFALILRSAAAERLIENGGFTAPCAVEGLFRNWGPHPPQRRCGG